MDKAKAAVSEFLGRSGHHDTTVDEKIAPAVQHETVKPHQHENVTTAVDKEVHQDHYHRTVQPVQDREVLPEQHTNRTAGVEHRKFDHRDHETTKHHLSQDQAQFKDTKTVEGTTTSQSTAPVVGGEHVHHHIHETIQPVVHKETIQPNVTHTTVPIHEVHHNKAVHHNADTLPAMTMNEFQSKGGVLQGHKERHDEFEGVPAGLQPGATGGIGSVRDHDHHSKTHGGLTSGTTSGHGVTGTHGTSTSTTAGNLSADHQSKTHGLTSGTTTSGTRGTSGSTGGNLSGDREGHHRAHIGTDATAPGELEHKLRNTGPN